MKKRLFKENIADCTVEIFKLVSKNQFQTLPSHRHFLLKVLFKRIRLNRKTLFVYERTFCLVAFNQTKNHWKR